MAVLKTWGQQLQEVQAALVAVNSSQRYSINGREVQRADLQFLLQREKYLVTMLETQGDIIAGSAVTRGSFQVGFS